MNDIIETEETLQATRGKIELLKQESLKLPQVEIPLKHYFAEGLYGREMFVPKGTIITGKIHKTSTIDVLLQGSMEIMDDSGVMKRVSAPMVIESKPGLSKAGYALEDVRWITLHAVQTETRDIAELERELVVDTYTEYLTHCKEQLRLTGE